MNYPNLAAAVATRYPNANEQTRDRLCRSALHETAHLFVARIVDANPYKQGKFTPGTRIPILAPEALRQARPDEVLILPWNLKDEIVEQHGYIREWGGRFIVPIPQLEVITP